MPRSSTSKVACWTQTATPGQTATLPDVTSDICCLCDPPCSSGQEPDGRGRHQQHRQHYRPSEHGKVRQGVLHPPAPTPPHRHQCNNGPWLSAQCCLQRSTSSTQAASTVLDNDCCSRHSAVGVCVLAMWGQCGVKAVVWPQALPSYLICCPSNHTKCACPCGGKSTHWPHAMSAHTSNIACHLLIPSP
jgi:hypothetical protein